MFEKTIRTTVFAALLLALACQAACAYTLTDEQKSYVDQWLAENGLNRFGDPKGTMYMGGTPLFNEATGEMIDRYDYVLARHPELVSHLGLPAGRRDLGEELRRLETELEMARKDLHMEKHSQSPDKERIRALEGRIAGLENAIKHLQGQAIRFDLLHGARD